MSVSFNAALNAYNNAAKMSANYSGTSEANNDDSSTSSTSSAFGSAFNNTIGNSTNQLRNAEQVAARSLVKQADLTDVVTAITSAEITLRTVVEVRNRLISAHQDILKMPI